MLLSIQDLKVSFRMGKVDGVAQRADAVKDYLASKGVDKNKITATGKGSTMPRTKADECPGKQSKKVIACLAQDRRVEIEATFSK